MIRPSVQQSCGIGMPGCSGRPQGLTHMTWLGQSPVSVAAARRTVQTAACATIEARPGVSPHPDAVRRRQEFEAMMSKREAERRQSKERESSGQKWWQGGLPNNMQSIENRTDLVKLLSQGHTGPRLMVLNFFTEDCYTCRSLHPKVKKLATSHPDVDFIKVNGSPPEMRPLFEELGITRVPYFHFYKNGAIVSQFTASLNPEKLTKLRMEITAHL